MQRARLGFLGIFSLWFFACGGKVVIDAGGEGGAGGGGSTSVGSSSSGSSSGTGGSSPNALCQAACDKLASIPNCGDSGCVQGCLDSFNQAGDCTSLLTEAAKCIAEHAGEGGTCEGVPCKPLLDEFSACVGGSNCSTGTCSSGPDGSCSCGGTCNGSSVQATCFPAPMGFTCVCNIDGKDVGKCEAPPDAFACDISGGCCASFF